MVKQSQEVGKHKQPPELRVGANLAMRLQLSFDPVGSIELRDKRRAGKRRGGILCEHIVKYGGRDFQRAQ